MMSEKIKEVLEWNEKFVDEADQDFFKKIAVSQSPWLTLLSCCDSRVQTNMLVDDATNEIFQVKVIGNTTDGAPGSLDYGINHLHTPVLMILGHSDCGAVKASLVPTDGLEDAVKESLEPIQKCLHGHDSEDLKDHIARNVDAQVEMAMERYEELVKRGKLTIVGAYYDLSNDYQEGYGKIHILRINNENQS